MSEELKPAAVHDANVFLPGSLGPVRREVVLAYEHDRVVDQLRAELAALQKERDRIMERKQDAIRKHDALVLQNRSLVAELAALKAGQGVAVAPYGYLREVDGNVQLSIGALRPADRSGGIATPWAAIFAAPPTTANAVSVPVELLERTISNLLYGSARDNADELRALLAQSESKGVK